MLDGRYRLVQQIAEGAMGAVYRAERVGLGREVAIKLMHASLPGALSARERFEREAHLMAKLEHANCVTVIDFGLYEDKPYLVMELVNGTSLHELVVREQQLPDKRAAEIARQILAGIAHAHAHDIIHRDIKPANIMVSPKAALGDHVQILDFGLARLLESSSLLTTGITVGTPSYMAPEQCRGAPLDLRVDLYAVGVVLFEMITGRKPFVAGDPMQIVKAQLTQAPPRMSEVTQREHGALEDIVARALQKQPGDRYASAVEMAAAIEAAVPGVRASSLPAIPTLGSSALTPIEDDESRRALIVDSLVEPSSPRPAPEPTQPLDPSEAAALRRALPSSRMKWMALFLVLLVAGGIYGIVRAKQYLAQQVEQK